MEIKKDKLDKFNIYSQFGIGIILIILTICLIVLTSILVIHSIPRIEKQVEEMGKQVEEIRNIPFWLGDRDSIFPKCEFSCSEEDSSSCLVINKPCLHNNTLIHNRDYISMKEMYEILK